MMLYRIKPLEWESLTNGSYWYAETVLGRITVERTQAGNVWWSLAHTFTSDLKPTSLDEAKAAAEAFYHDRMKQGLVEATQEDINAADRAICARIIESITPQSTEQEGR